MSPGPVRRRSSRRHYHERRQKFLDATLVAIRRDGPKVSMEAIARQAGVTKPVVYRLFGDRDGLLRALGEKLAADVVTEVTAALDRAGNDPKAMLRTAIEAYIALIDEENEVYRFVSEHSGSGTDMTGLSAEVARAIAVVLGEQLRERGHDSGAAEPWAFGIVGMVHLAGDWWTRTRTLPRDRLVTYLVDLLWDGFVALEAREQPADE